MAASNGEGRVRRMNMRMRQTGSPSPGRGPFQVKPLRSAGDASLASRGGSYRPASTPVGGLPAGAKQLRTFSYVVHSEFNILIHGFQNPDQQEWDAYLTELTPLVRKDVLRGVLVRSLGGGPNPHQRRQIVELYKGKSLPVANVSDSAVTRAITTAIGWFYKGKMRSFSPADLVEAIAHLNVPEAQRPSMLQCIAALSAARGIIA